MSQGPEPSAAIEALSAAVSEVEQALAGLAPDADADEVGRALKQPVRAVIAAAKEALG